MGISERKEREKHEMRELVLQTALTLFIEKGYDSVSIRKIADVIEYSPGTIYLYFKDKDEIFFELHNRGFTEFYQYQLSVQNISDPLKRLEAHGKAYLEFALSHKELYDIMFISLAPAKKIKLYHNWELGERTYALLKQNVQDCIDEGYFAGFNTEIVSFSMWSFVHGIASLIVRQRLQLIPQEVVDHLSEGAMSVLMNTALTLRK